MIRVEKRLICYFLTFWSIFGTSDAGIMKKLQKKMKFITWPSEGVPVVSSYPIPPGLTKDIEDDLLTSTGYYEVIYSAIMLHRSLLQKGIPEQNLFNSDVFLQRYLWDSNRIHNVDLTQRMLKFYARTRKKLTLIALMTFISPLGIYENFLCFLGATDHDDRPVLQLPCTKNCDLKKCIENGLCASVEAFFKENTLDCG